MKKLCAQVVRVDGKTRICCSAEIVKDDGVLWTCAAGHSSNEAIVLAPGAAYRGYGKRKAEL